ncbi:MAG: hypothetical protein JWO01_2124 [Microbacteriaceae bacterium]|nr:hypothetical protein [Microbacteriaceae bacterium]
MQIGSPKPAARHRWRAAVLTMFSGAPDGQPDWVQAMEDGEDAGLFGPGSAVWAVNGATPTLVAGIRALLMQTLHPGAMAGVHDWSRYREDPMGRLSGTVRWVLTTTFGDTAAARASSAWVGRLHDHVSGSYNDSGGADVAYSAHDPELLSWVHLAFTEAFLGAHLAWGGAIPGGADRYVFEWARAGRLMGVQSPPESAAELREQLLEFAPRLKPDRRVLDAVRFLRNPPLVPGARFGYRVFFAGAVASLPADYRRMLGLRRPWWPAMTATRIGLRAIAALLGRPSSSEEAARMRIARLGASAR